MKMIILKDMVKEKKLLELQQKMTYLSYTSDQDFRSTNVNDDGEATNDNGCNLYVFDIQY